MGDAMLGVDVTVVRTAAEGPEWPLGSVWQDPRTGYKYIYINADTAIADGDILTPTLTDADVPWSLVPAAAVGLVVAGVGIVAIAAEGFGWVQIKGKKTNCKIEDAAVAGDMIGTSATAGRGVVITFTTTAATLAQLTAGFNALRGVRITPISAGSANNLADVWLDE